MNSMFSDVGQGTCRWHIKFDRCLIHILYVAKGIVLFSQLDDKLLER